MLDTTIRQIMRWNMLIMMMMMPMMMMLMINDNANNDMNTEH